MVSPRLVEAFTAKPSERWYVRLLEKENRCLRQKLGRVPLLVKLTNKSAPCVSECPRSRFGNVHNESTGQLVERAIFPAFDRRENRGGEGPDDTPLRRSGGADPCRRTRPGVT